jgi:uncharacterized protein (TIGR03067 family)
MRLLPLLGLLVAAVAFGDPGPIKGRPPADPAICGDWVLVKTTAPLPPASFPSRTEFTKDGIRIEHGHDTDAVIEQKPFTLNNQTSPRHLDFYARLDEAVEHRGIYVIEGDTLTICTTAFGDGKRPTKFEAPPRSGLILCVYKRKEKK